MSSQVNSNKCLEKVTTYPKTIAEEETLLCLFYEATITLISKPDKDTIKMKIIGQ